MDTFTNLTQSYDDLWEMRDRRVDGYPLMDGLSTTVYLCVAFVILTKILGPWYMKDKEPMDIKKFLVVYNVAQIVLNVYIVAGVRPTLQYIIKI